MNDSTFQGNGKIAYVPIVVNTKLPKPITNGDRIRSMTDDELAVEATAHGGCPHNCETPDDMDTDCVKCWLDWIKQEASE